MSLHLSCVCDPVLHLHQLYGDRIQPHVPPLVDLMVQALGVDPTETPSTPSQVYKDMKYAQVKTLTFLSHYIRQDPSLMEPYEQAICNSLVILLKTCPDVVAWRKELLMSMRTVLATDFKKTLNERFVSLISPPHNNLSQPGVIGFIVPRNMAFL